MNEYKHSLFSVYGIELEYMIVDKQSLNVLPISDKLLRDSLGQYTDELGYGDVAWNNELVLHVLEIKTNGPTNTLNALDKSFHQNILTANQKLSEFNAVLMPTGAHPWMDPLTEMQLWPHGDKEIYETYHRIFNCQGHGWANLQSAHINLPFKNNEEFTQLHQAIRLALPLLPALTASTPVLDGKITGISDTRLMYYGNNQKFIPIISGLVIPERIYSIDDYHETILQPMYQAISVHDPKKVLQYEWLNSRGAIARFDRGAIEIRTVDIQECPKADIACIYAIVELIKYLCHIDHDIENRKLRIIFDEVIKLGQDALITDFDYLQLFSCSTPTSANELWRIAIEQFQQNIPEEYRQVLQYILEHGNLSQRITKSLDKKSIKNVYQDLISCLSSNEMLKVDE